MDIIVTLTTLIEKATNPQNQNFDTAAIDSFCNIIEKKKDGPQIASKILATRIQSKNEAEALLTLNLLDTCMKRCGQPFHTEIGKFRFLNEMIKLVSTKYLGATTPAKVRQKIIELLFSWTQSYPQETKIKEAYEMLKNQGVAKDDTSAKTDANRDKTKSTASLFEDEETSKLLKELLHSKDPFELKLANRLIKSIVKDDEKRVQRTTQQTNFEFKIESVHNNAKLLSEMLDSYDPNNPSCSDTSLMKELYLTCENFTQNLVQLTDEIEDNEHLLDQVLTLNDELCVVFEKYKSKMSADDSNKNAESTISLLDLETSQDNISENGKIVDSNLATNSTKQTQSDMEILSDIFSSIEKPANNFPPSNSDLLGSNVDIMQPIPILPSSKAEPPKSAPAEVEKKLSALEELNNISKSMLQQDLLCNTSTENTSASKKLDNSSSLLLMSSEPSVIPTKTNLCTDLLNDFDVKLKVDIENQLIGEKKDNCNVLNNLNILENNLPQKDNDVTESCQELKLDSPEIKSLMDIHVTLEDVKPSSIPPINVINDKNNISVIFHIAEGSLHPNVSVVVITTMSRNTKPLTNYMLQAVVPENCKCRLQSPSSTELPAHNSFLPPSAITQIMLISNPKKIPISIKFMLSYTLDDETYTEMGELDKLFNL